MWGSYNYNVRAKKLHRQCLSVMHPLEDLSVCKVYNYVNVTNNNIAEGVLSYRG